MRSQFVAAMVALGACAELAVAQPAGGATPATEKKAAAPDVRLLSWQQRVNPAEFGKAIGYWESSQRGLEIAEALGEPWAGRVPAIRERRKALEGGVDGLNARLKELGEDPAKIRADIRNKQVDEMLTKSLKSQGGALMDAWEKFEKVPAMMPSVSLLLAFNEKLAGDPKAEIDGGLVRLWSGDQKDALGTVTTTLEIPASWGKGLTSVKGDVVIRAASRGGYGDDTFSAFVSLIDRELVDEARDGFYKTMLDKETYAKHTGLTVLDLKETEIAGVRIAQVTLEVQVVEKAYTAKQVLRQMSFLKGRSTVSLQVLCSSQAETEAKLPATKELLERAEKAQPVLEQAVRSLKSTEVKAEKPPAVGGVKPK